VGRQILSAVAAPDHGVRSPKFSARRSELDPAWLAIRLLTALGLAALVSAPIPARNR
jgi:fatty-acid desaturase